MTTAISPASSNTTHLAIANGTCTCGEYLLHLLEQYGVDQVFGIPGVHTIELYRNLHKTRIKHTTPRHEQGAGFMAEGYARVSGKPGNAGMISGTGVTNIVTAMGQARLDSIPMLVISTVNRTPIRWAWARVDYWCRISISSPLACRCSPILSCAPQNLPKVLARAFAVFNTKNPASVHIEIPLDVMNTPIGERLRLANLAAAVDPAPTPEVIRRHVLCWCRQSARYRSGWRCGGYRWRVRKLARKLDAPATMNTLKQRDFALQPSVVGGRHSVQ